MSHDKHRLPTNGICTQAETEDKICKSLAEALFEISTTPGRKQRESIADCIGLLAALVGAAIQEDDPDRRASRFAVATAFNKLGQPIGPFRAEAGREIAVVMIEFAANLLGSSLGAMRADAAQADELLARCAEYFRSTYEQSALITSDSPAPDLGKELN